MLPHLRECKHKKFGQSRKGPFTVSVRLPFHPLRLKATGAGEPIQPGHSGYTHSITSPDMGMSKASPCGRFLAHPFWRAKP